MLKNPKMRICIYTSIFILLIIVAISIYILYISSTFPANSTDKIDSTYSKVNSYLSDYKNYNIEILREFNNILYGTIIDENLDPILFSTYATFSYDTLNDNFNINILDNNI